MMACLHHKSISRMINFNVVASSIVITIILSGFNFSACYEHYFSFPHSNFLHILFKNTAPTHQKLIITAYVKDSKMANN
jgi:hypothetical protein